MSDSCFGRTIDRSNQLEAWQLGMATRMADGEINGDALKTDSREGGGPDGELVDGRVLRVRAVVRSERRCKARMGQEKTRSQRQNQTRTRRMSRRHQAATTNEDDGRAERRAQSRTRTGNHREQSRRYSQPEASQHEASDSLFPYDERTLGENDHCWPRPSSPLCESRTVPSDEGSVAVKSIQLDEGSRKEGAWQRAERGGCERTCPGC